MKTANTTMFSVISLTANEGAVTVVVPANMDAIVNTTEAEIAAMHAAFRKVENPTNWKFPIDAAIPMADRDVTARAIEWFAGCPATFEEHFRAGFLRVTAVGYYAAVGA